jgi:hypothetical protein
MSHWNVASVAPLSRSILSSCPPFCVATASVLARPTKTHPPATAGVDRIEPGTSIE